MKAQSITVAEASKLMGCSQQFIRIGLQRGILPIGSAIKISGNRYTYYISVNRLNEYLKLKENEQ